MDFKIVFCTYFPRIESFRYKSEKYDEHTLFCVKSGSFRYRIANKEGVLSQGMAILCPSGACFEREIITPTELCMIKFSSPSISLPIEDGVLLSPTDRFDYNMEKLRNCHFCTDFSQNQSAEHFALDIIYMFLNAENKKQGRLPSAYEFINLHYLENISIKELAESEGYTVVHFINKFKEYYGTTPNAYIIALRLGAAERLLLNTELSIKEIAARAGFKDEFYFIRLFKQKVGLTPGKYRKSAL